MSAQTKLILLLGFIAGALFAALIAGFDYYSGSPFQWWKLILNFTFFGAIMGVMMHYNLKNRKK